MVRMSQLRLLITAGPTREYIDPVRYISNDSSGRMGVALARAARDRGHRVTLIHGPLAVRVPVRVVARPVVSAEQMLRACRAAWPRHDALLMAAAVADYAPLRAHALKLKKSDRPPALRLRPTPDVLADLSRRRRPGQIVVGFALEDRAGRRNAEEKLRRKGLDAIVLNRPAAIGAERAALEVLVRGRPWQTLPESGKDLLAKRLIRLLERICRDRA